MALMPKGRDQTAADPLDLGWAQLEAGEWEAARTLFEGVLASEETPEALEG